jgi:hypothetical protein
VPREPVVDVAADGPVLAEGPDATEIVKNKASSNATWAVRRVILLE